MRQFLTQGRFFTLVAVGGALAVIGFTMNSAPDAAEATQEIRETPLPVQVLVAKPVSSFLQTRHYTGTLVARRTSDVSFERSARILEITVDEGDQVEQGQELGRLDTRRLNTRERMLQAQRAAAAAQLEELVAGPRQETIGAARAQVAELVANVELSERTHRRTEKLQSRKSTSEQAVDNTRLSLEGSRARLVQAEQQLEELITGTRPERIAAQTAMVEQLDAQIADIQLDREDSTLKAPFSGRVSMRYVDEGAMASPGNPVLRIVESTAVEARIGLPNSSISGLASGDSFTLLHGDKSLRATYARILPEVDMRTRTRVAVFTLSDEDSVQVTPGETVRITMNDRVDTSGFWLPTSSLSPGQRGLWSAYVVAEQDGFEQVQSRPVEVLHTEGERVLVSGTIRPEDRVITGGIQRVVPGQRVRVSD